MQLFVVGLDGSTFTVRSETRTVEEVKQCVEEEQGVPPEQQRLVFQGTELEAGRGLDYYGVQNGSTLHLSMDLRGGDSYIYDPKRVEFLAMWHLLNKKICRNCYGRLPPSATRCSKAKCGRTTDIRPKKLLYCRKHNEERVFNKIGFYIKNNFSNKML